MTYNALDWHNIIAMFCGETEWISFCDEKCLDALKAETLSDI